jgi:hypothetical protein
MLGRWIYQLIQSLSPIRRGFASGFVNYKKGCTRLAATCDKVYQLLAHGRWFSPGTLASSTKFGQNEIKDVASRVFTKMLQKDWQNEGQTDSSITIDWLIDFWCFNATFNNISAISWRPVLVVEEARVPGENHRPAWLAQWVRSLDLTTHTSILPIRVGSTPAFVHYKTGCTRLAATCDKVYQLLAHGRWFSPDIGQVLTNLNSTCVLMKSKVGRKHNCIPFLMELK